jgi:putative transposase
MGLKEALMKLVVKVQDVVELARRFETSPLEAMREVVTQVRAATTVVLEQVMEAEITLFLGEEAERDKGNKRNGYTKRTFSIRGLGALELRVPRDRAGRFTSHVVPPGRRYDEATEKDLALLHLSGLSTRMLAQLSSRILDVKVSSTEVSNALAKIVPAAKRFVERPLDDRRWKYLYVDGTNFRVRRTTVDLEPVLVVVGVDETWHKSVIAMVQGDKDSKTAWEMVFSDLKARGLDGSAVELGIMDGLPGLADAFRDAFPRARVARCWVHKAMNVFPLVPTRYQAEFKTNWDAVAYAEGKAQAQAAFAALKERWTAVCNDAIARLEKDLDALLAHYDFPREHWEALRTTNPIERVNKEFKRRFKAMETIGPEGLKALLAFTALRLEFGWSTTPITSNKLSKLVYRERQQKRMEAVTRPLLN